MDTCSFVDFPQDLKDILIQFCVAYFIERPNNISKFGVNYFEIIKKQKELELNIQRKRLNSMRISKLDVTDGYIFHRNKIVEPEQNVILPEISVPKSEIEIRLLKEILTQYPIFRLASRTTLHELIEKMPLHLYTPNSSVYHENDNIEAFFIVKEGVFELWRSGSLWKTIHKGGGFGDLALVSPPIKCVSVKAVTCGEIWKLDRRVLRNVFYYSEFKRRIEYEDLFNRLEIFRRLNQNEKMSLADALLERHYKSNETIYEQGDISHGMHFILKGEVVLSVKTHEKNETVLELHVGQYFGEIGFLTGACRSTTAYASDDVLTAYMDISTFNRLISICKTILYKNYEEPV